MADLKIKKLEIPHSMLDSDLSDRCFMYYTTLQNTFQKHFESQMNRPIFKIKYGNKTVYRKYAQGANYKINKGEIGLLDIDLKYLNLIDINFEVEQIKIQVSPANRIGKFLFYYNNPRESVWISFRIMIWGIPISFIINLIATYVYNQITSH